MQSSYAFCMATVGFTEWSSKGLFPERKFLIEMHFLFSDFLQRTHGRWFIHGAKFWRLQLSGKIVPDFQSVLDCQAKQKLGRALCTCPLLCKIQPKSKINHTTWQHSLRCCLLQFSFGLPPPPLDSDKALKEPCLDICTNARRRRELGRNSSPDDLSCPQVWYSAW